MPPEWLPQVRLPGVYEFYRSQPPALLLADRALGFQIYDDVFQGHRPARVLKEAKLDATFAVGVADQRIRLARASGARGLCQLHAHLSLLHVQAERKAKCMPRGRVHVIEADYWCKDGLTMCFELLRLHVQHLPSSEESRRSEAEEAKSL